ncbi:MAG: histidine triad nucleotide-binding protein [Chloroflexota bacterium]
MPCLFCQIAARKIPASILYQDDLVTAFRDIHPQAPAHILIIPNQHLDGVAALNAGHAPLLAALFTAATQLATQEGLADDGYRLVLNQGRNGGQSVFHLHLHLLGGRRMSWPPG